MNIKELFGLITLRVMVKYQEEITKSKINVVELSESEQIYLEQIYLLKNPTFSEFASAIKTSKPAATQIISKYIKKGYVYKIQSENDKRVFNIYLSDNLKNYFAESGEIIDGIFEEELSILSKEEYENLNIIFEKIYNGGK